MLQWVVFGDHNPQRPACVFLTLGRHLTSRVTARASQLNGYMPIVTSL
jgi:hypothetical protein